MAIVQLDARGMKCPMPVLKMTERLVKQEVKAGDVLEVTADCDTFERDVREWCKNFKKVMIVYKEQGASKVAQVQI
ncbi:MAG TPA: sulfurtransferase TusA family protein [Planctomycetota bacterium]|jgi:tRNA 2-thiouridine synthesizing protein A